MLTRRLLIIAPAVIILILLQSYFWVPSYEQQTRGNPDRLVQYITASAGDASILNPILSADTASSQIQSQVFDSLIDRDKDLHFRGRLALSWDIYEEAFFHMNPTAAVPGLSSSDPESVAGLIRSAAQTPGRWSGAVAESLANIQAVTILPSRTFSATHAFKGPEGAQQVDAQISAPARVRLVLNRVDQDLFKNLEPLLGAEYFSSFPSDAFLSTDVDLPPEQLSVLAESMVPAVEHNPIIVFHLRPGVRFHDGHVFDAGDVKFTYEAIMNPKNLSPRVADYEPVKAVEVIDPLTVKITYKRLYSPAIGTWGMGILPEHLLNPRALREEAERLDKDPATFTLRQSRFGRNPVGCGPFRFTSWKSDQYIRLTRFGDYWEGPPNYTQYAVRIIPDPLTQEMEFYAGTIDSYQVQPHQVARLSEDARFQNFSGISFGYTYIGYNMRRAPFKDPRVRKALGMAIDVDKIIRYVLHGQGERITGPFVKQTGYYNHDISPLPYDPEGALELLESAGWRRNASGWLEKDGRRLAFTLITNSGNQLRQAILAVAQDAWKKIGVDVRTDLLEWSVFIQERVNKLDFDALILGWQMGIDPDLYQIWHSSQTGPYQLNFVGFENKEADDLIIKIRQEYDHRKQVAYCHRLHRIIAEAQPYNFLYVRKWTAVLDKRIVIREQGPDGSPVYRKITPTKTGDYAYDFNKWIKLPGVPVFAQDG
ncbi:ABC transporter, substrate-binding protein (cluster 5, nickel/peptides/opines) [Olavius algarvensis associated proteobacterium Delta 3]|nr:ABC transporter, substrate-binding protein (cluster 5, nickel/peptides/opines) [Olavius algarvensis associated proteobacterium Delta 3]CAB5161322.1 ABC transporter, substrate-binding protein (cluster 5, nickel/peptides/opines) [Olavius algarvensis associated proteobacterium Delta 3]